ncbi:MAG TPA: Rieske 2Fe-2S domain-containing protein [Gaiellaceae bacterium]|nr:Rieske 2Fe-2S domain-containing protein [Gaiellaceae bacterium]
MEPVRIPLTSLDADGRAVVEVAGTEIAVFVVDGEAHAFANACPHEGNPLHEGEILGDTLTCAYHGWKFDLGTGACLFGDEPAGIFKAEIQNGEVVVTP